MSVAEVQSFAPVGQALHTGVASVVLQNPVKQVETPSLVQVSAFDVAPHETAYPYVSR